jgi:O-acetyl-ADP-ribose deacetylase (regulator of RNase III)
VIRVRIDDLAFFDGEAIIRPVNEDLGATTPLLRRLELAAGTQLYNQIRLQEPLPVGAAIVTSAGELAAELLVHAVVMSRTEPVSSDTVRRALTSALQRVQSWQIRQVAIPPFGLGAGNLDVDESARVMLDVIAAHVGSTRYPEDITLVAETADEERALTNALTRSGLCRGAE